MLNVLHDVSEIYCIVYKTLVVLNRLCFLHLLPSKSHYSVKYNVSIDS